MPILTPSAGPPRSPLSEKTANVPTISTGLVAPAVDKLQPPPIMSSKEEAVDSDRLVDEPSRKIPRVILNEDSIQDVVAAQMISSIVGHVLFLKNQTPFPIKQLPRVPIGKTNPRALKLKTELLDSYDTLSAHFVTTFRAISTALAKARVSKEASLEPQVSRAYMAILLGPSIGTAKSKIVVGFDGLETKVWGADVVREREQRRVLSQARDEVAQPGQAEEGILSEEDDSDSEPEYSDEGAGGESEDEGSHSDEDSEEDPPSSDGEGDEDSEGSESLSEDEDISAPPMPPTPQASTTVQYGSAKDDQTTKSIKDADRLLSRTLAQAEADGLGMASEMSPTQMHILIRAPRRFDHPAWIPRQNIQTSMDVLVEEYLQEASLSSEASLVAPKKKKRGPPLEGVWIGCKTQAEEASKLENEVDVAEADEMIWWSWDGKIVGFSDW